MQITPELESVTVVVVGNFNPAIFSPAWFAFQGLLPRSVAENANLLINHPEITDFRAESLRVTVTQDRLTVKTQSVPHVKVCDLVARIFTELLPHTPLKCLGINRDVHFLVRDKGELDRIGRALAPSEPWGELGIQLGFHEEHGGMTFLTMTRNAPDGRAAGDQVNVRVSPSEQLASDGKIGVFVGINDHYTLTETPSQETALNLMKVLKENFSTSLKRSGQIIDHVESLKNRDR